MKHTPAIVALVVDVTFCFQKVPCHVTVPPSNGEKERSHAFHVFDRHLGTTINQLLHCLYFPFFCSSMQWSHHLHIGSIWIKPCCCQHLHDCHLLVCIRNCNGKLQVFV